MADKTHINITVPIPVQTLRDLLCTAVEGGSNYWAEFTGAIMTTGPDGMSDYDSIRVAERPDSGRDQLVKRGRIVKAEDLAKGISRLAAIAFAEDGARSASFPAAGKHFADALDNHDSATADVVLQMTIFGELIYG